LLIIWLKIGVKYSDGSANWLVHRTFEAMQYHLMASVLQFVAKRKKAACPKFMKRLLSRLNANRYLQKS